MNIYLVQNLRPSTRFICQQCLLTNHHSKFGKNLLIFMSNYTLLSAVKVD